MANYRRQKDRQSNGMLKTLLLAAAASFLTVCTVFYPEEAFNASINGLAIWWNIVFPALLPFFILSQILIGLGVVHMMGIFLEPVMRPLFNVPGVGSFVLAMGLASGFPLGAVLTADMRRQKLVSKMEAERLVSFVNTSDPLFLFGAVAVGMFGLPEIGATLAAAHYLSCLSLGLIMRFYGRDPAPTAEEDGGGEGLLSRALDALIKARREDGRTLGQLMGDAVHRSINTQMLIGGFIILFSVIIGMLEVIGIAALLSSALAFLLSPLGLDPALSRPLISGLLEIDLGCQAAAGPDLFVPLDQKMIAVSAIIAWSGLSVHAQVASIVSDTDISIKPYIKARLVHAILAGFYTYLLTGAAEQALHGISIPVFLSTIPSGTGTYWWARTYFIFQKLSLFLLGMFLLSMLLHYYKKIKTVYGRDSGR